MLRVRNRASGYFDFLRCANDEILPGNRARPVDAASRMFGVDGIKKSKRFGLTRSAKLDNLEKFAQNVTRY